MVGFSGALRILFDNLPLLKLQFGVTLMSHPVSLLSLFDAHELRRFETGKDAKMTLQALTDYGSSSSRPAVM